MITSGAKAGIAPSVGNRRFAEAPYGVWARFRN
jgi:hypothetical protein